MIVDRPKARSLVNAIISAHFGPKAISVLEAGGGDFSRITQARNINVSRITVVDIDQSQLDRNNYANFKIKADLQDLSLEDKYDLIEVIYVLEHIKDVEKALSNITEACSNDGLIVISCPYMYSLSGIVTRFTPHWFHVFFRKYVSGEKNAGKEGYPPFRTFYNPLIAPSRLEKFLNEGGFSTELRVFFESKIYKRIGSMKFPIIAIISVINIFTPKSYNARNGEYCIVFRKKIPNQS